MHKNLSLENCSEATAFQSVYTRWTYPQQVNLLCYTHCSSFTTAFIFYYDFVVVFKAHHQVKLAPLLYGFPQKNTATITAH